MNTLIENNTLIAEFMGKEKDVQYLHKPTNQWCMADELKFHFDWNWLMTVVEKIIGMQDLYAQKRHDIYMAINPKIDITYQAVLEFIKWYNNKLKS